MTEETPSATTSLVSRSATELASLLRERQISARELLQAHLDQIDRVNPSVNAIVSMVPEQAMERAKQLDDDAVRGDFAGPLHGLPTALKDTSDAKGITSTYGSPLFVDNVPEADSLHGERIRAAGAVILGKTNVPEFGAGSHTFNTVFGTTYNPYDLSRSAGGSSGGAAAALASRMLPIADGSDMGGSLRNPASFCNVLGFRPSPGRIPAKASQAAWNPFVTAGPMARSMDDLCLMMSVMAGFDDRSPIALGGSGEQFLLDSAESFKPLRLAWSPDLGGSVPVDSDVTDVLEAALPVWSDLGCTVELDSPDFTGADELFQTVRAWVFHGKLGEGVRQKPEMFKETIRWNVAQGAKLSGQDLYRAETLHAELFNRMRSFFQKYDALLLPVSQVPPFPAEVEYPTTVAGVPQNTYIDWMQSSHFITSTGCPTISVPAGFDRSGLPIGLQIVGPHLADKLVLQLAKAFESKTGYAATAPSI